MQDFSADASISMIIREYLQPFELAMLTGLHNLDTYCDAARNGSVEYLFRYKSNGANFVRSLKAAAKTSQLKAMKLLIRFGAQEFESTFYSAIEADQVEAMQFLIKYGATASKEAFRHAAKFGSLAAMKFLDDLGFADCDNALFWAARFGQTDVVVLLVKISKISLNFDRAICAASRFGYIEIVKLLAKYGRDGMGNFDHSRCTSMLCFKN